MFQKIFVINLRRRVDRKIKMLWRLKALDIKVEFIDAFDGKSEDVIKMWNKTDRSISAGEFAYVSTWHHILKNICLKDTSVKKALFLDDDVIFRGDIEDRLVYWQDVEWKILYLGATQHKEIDWNMAEKKGWYYPFRTAGSFAVGVDRSLFKRIVELIETCRFNRVLDSGILIRLVSENEGSAMVIHPPVAIASVEESDLRDGRNQEDMCKKCHWGSLDEFQKDIMPLLKILVKVDDGVSIELLDRFLENVVEQTYERKIVVVKCSCEDAYFEERVKTFVKSFSKTCAWRFPLFHHQGGRVFCENEGVSYDIFLSVEYGCEDVFDREWLGKRVIELLEKQ